MSTPVDVRDQVILSEGSITLPTYGITGENRNPVFRSQYGVAHIYPYTLQDEIASKSEPKTYHTLEMENQYLKVTIIPDLGGRVYSVYDKISAREVFYKNSFIKFSPLAIRGAFFSGGVEFSFPVAHAPTTCEHVNWDTRQNPDGSASISFGGLEHISGLQWMITLTLFPNRCALAQDVQLYNPGYLPGRYHYWTNASLDANDRTEFIYPLRRARSYEYAGTASWPFARLDLITRDPGLPGMEGVPMWPAKRLQSPVNFRWQKNMLAQVSVFGRNVEWDFFGAWQHSVDHGYAHFAKARDVSGMKLWSWGNAEVGVVNQSALTDDGSVYAETQCGAMETQLDFDFLQPGKTRAWREWWLPLRGLGGLTCASEQVGAKLRLTPSADDGNLTLSLAVCPVAPVPGARVQLSVPDRILLEQTVDLSPERPWKQGISLKAAELGNQPLTITVSDASGVLLDYVLDRNPNPVEPYVPPSKPEEETADSMYQLGLNHENFDNREQAKEAYQKALALDPKHAQAAFRYGLMLFRSAEFEAARRHLQIAASFGVPEADYFLGELCFLLQEYWQARKYFNAFSPDSPVYPAAQVGLGRIAMQTGLWDEATRYFGEACDSSEAPMAASLLLGITLRRQGRMEEARQVIQDTLARIPLSHPALREMAFLDTTTPAHQEKLMRMLKDDPHYWMDMASYYLQAGLSEDALQVLQEAGQTWDDAMLHYLLGYLLAERGKQTEAASHFKLAAQAKSDYVFPSRLVEVLALEKAIWLSPTDARAKMYLGNFYYAHERYQEGRSLWEAALEDLPEDDVLLRNLGLAAWQRDQDLAGASELFEKALRMNPRNYDLYLHLDDLYKAQGLVEKRQALLAKIQELDGPREDVRKRKVMMLVDLGRYPEALQIMTGEQFVPLEMDQSFHNLYVRAWLLSAEDHLNAGQVDQAIDDCLKALDYPPNLGVGRPTTRAQAEVYYRLGCAFEQAGRYRKALHAWYEAAREHHPHGELLFEFVQKALDKLSRYSEVGLEVTNA
jgi:tetratricopeptide (TPR) repeat protein